MDNGVQKNIMLLIPDLGAGGAERVVSNLSRRIPKDIKRYIVLHYAKNIEYGYDGQLINLGVNFRRDLHLLGGILLGTVRLNKIKEEHDIDTTISFLSQSHHINLLTHILGYDDDKIILSVRNNQSIKFKNSLYGIFAKLFIKLFYNEADTIVTLSDGVKRDLVENFGIDKNKIKTIYNPTDIETIRSQYNEVLSEKVHRSIFDSKGPVIVNIGSLNEQKGQWHLIRAFYKVKKNVPDSKLVFLGEGKLEGYLERLTEGLGLEDSVFFLGYQKNPFKFLYRSDVFVLSSLFEGFGNVITEAMACGLPIISTDCRSGPREIISPDTDVDDEAYEVEYSKYGILTPVCDGKRYSPSDPLTEEEELLVRSITDILKDEELKEKYSNRSLERVQDFGVDKITKQWVDLL